MPKPLKALIRNDKELIVVGDRVLVKAEDGEERTKVGLYLPSTAIDSQAGPAWDWRSVDASLSGMGAASGLNPSPGLDPHSTSHCLPSEGTNSPK